MRSRLVGWATILCLGAGACGGHADVVPSAVATEVVAAAPSNAALPGASPKITSLASAFAQASPVPNLPQDPQAAKKAAADAERCLDNPLCSEADAIRLTTLAADLGSDTSCELFYYGRLVPKDFVRARICYERAVVREGPCTGGGSASASRIQLVTMLVDGQGGPAEMTRGRHLFDGCFEDSSSLWLTQETTPAARAARGRPLDFCADLGGTTLSQIDCMQSTHDADEIERKRLLKGLAVQLGPQGLDLERTASIAFDAFATADASRVGDDSRNGSMRPIQELSWASSLLEARNGVLRALFAPKPATTAKEREEAKKQEGQAVADALRAAGDDETRSLIRASQTAFEHYRSAEVAFEAADGDEAGARAVWTRLSRERAKGLAKPAP